MSNESLSKPNLLIKNGAGDLSENIIILLLLLITALGQIAIDIYLPSLPAMQSAFGTTKDTVQLTLSIYSIGFGLSQLFYGPLSDRFGRRDLLLFGMGISSIATLACSLSTHITALICFRLIQGIGSGAASVLTRAILRDCFSGKRMSQIGGYMSIAWSLIPMIAPVIGSYIQTAFNWRANFIFLLIFNLFVLALTYHWLPDTNRDKRLISLKLKTIIRHYFSVLSHPTAFRFILGPMLTFSCTFSYITASPFLLQVELGYTPIMFGWLSLGVSIAYLFANLVNSRLLAVMDKTHIIRLGILCNTIGTVSMTLFALLGIFNVYTLIIPAGIMIFAGGFLFANCMTSAMMPFGHIAGTAAAVIGCIQMLGGSLASGIVALLPMQTPLPLSLLLLSFTVLLAWSILPLKAT